MTEYDVTEAMIRFGGNFVQQLGRLIRSADTDNKRRLVDAFPEYLAKYREVAARVGSASAKDQPDLAGTEPRLSKDAISALTRKQVIDHARMELRSLYADMEEAEAQARHDGHSRTANTIKHYKNRLMFTIKNLGSGTPSLSEARTGSGQEACAAEDTPFNLASPDPAQEPER